MSILDLLPTLNAFLNTCSLIFLLLGGYFIKFKKDIARHKRCMLTAVVSSSFFLISYLTYHAFRGSVHFEGTGRVRTIYFIILVTHVILAAAIVPMVVRILIYAKREDFVKHKRLARITWPLWVYVSITGDLVYLMLYHWYN